MEWGREVFGDFGDSWWTLKDAGRFWGRLILNEIWRTVWDYFGNSLVDLVGMRLILKGGG